MSDKEPRLLRVQRIEDEDRLPFRVPVHELPQLREWVPFFEALVAGERGGNTQPLAEAPDIVTIDFGFGNDDTLPKVRRERKFFSSDVPFVWSNALSQPNTGILMAAAVMALWSGRDFPIAIALHSGAGAQVWSDMSSAVLIAQFLALGGMWEPSVSAPHPLEQLNGFLEESLNTSADDALPTALPRYRKIFLGRCGIAIGNTAGAVHRLDADPGSVNQLAALLVSPLSSEKLHAALGRTGLVVRDSRGQKDCIDLRSLFADRVVREWKRKPAGPGRDVLELIDEPVDFIGLLGSIARDAVLAAGLVRHNASSKAIRRLPNKAHSLKFLALTFALVEDHIREFEFRNRPWDPVEGCVAPGEKAPPLVDQCVVVAQAWRRRFGSREGQLVDLVAVFEKLKKQPTQTGPVAAFYTGIDSRNLSVALRNVIAELEGAGVLANTNGTEGFTLLVKVPSAGKSGDEARSFGLAVARCLDRSEKEFPQRIARLLGILSPRRKRPNDYYQEFGRIEKSEKVKIVADFRRDGTIPQCVRARVSWFVETYHPDAALPESLLFVRKLPAPTTISP
jgi:hypothetical protein